jgi:acyl-coenzyme A synthetase/AMP-(fatty) acid ligase
MLILEDLAAYSFSLRECVAAGEPLNPEIIETWKKGTAWYFAMGMDKRKALVSLPICRR